MISLNPEIQLEVLLVPESGGTIEVSQVDTHFYLELAPFVKGETGDPSALSTDAGNIITTGTDGGLYVPAPSLETEHW
jgi:hypothetical protein